MRCGAPPACDTSRRMVGWSELRQARPDLAAASRELFYQFGVGLGFLATIRRDGGPRVHPVCPVITDEGLYALIIPSPKRADLHRDGRYALHAFPVPRNEDACCLTGTAVGRRDRDLRRSIDSVFLAERGWDDPPPGFDDHELFELLVGTCLITRTTGHGDFDPKHTVWRAP
jgi:hypothetical protein